MEQQIRVTLIIQHANVSAHHHQLVSDYPLRVIKIKLNSQSHSEAVFSSVGKKN